MFIAFEKKVGAGSSPSLRLTLFFALALVISIVANAHTHDEGESIATDAAVPIIDTYPNQYVSGTLPVLYINTENGQNVTSKEVYINATYFIDNPGNSEFETIGSYSNQLAMEIRGRGHSSWKGAKKPYKLKLGEKRSLFGMPKSKHWALIKPSENTVAGLQLGQIMNMAWTPHYQPVEVVLNNDYIGLYFLMETIRIAKDRVNIYEQADGETDPNLIKGGWLVEIDNYSDDNQISIRENTNWNMNVKYHSPENLSSVQKNWLTNEFTAMNAAIYSKDKRSKDWENYIDVGSMARFFIIQEVMDNPDGFHGSFYLHKDLADDAKWVAGPIWDLVCYFRDKTDYTFKMKVHYGFTPHWIGEIIQYDSFCKAVANAWAEVHPTKLDEIYDHIDQTILPLAEAWSRDCERWGDDPTQTAEVRANRIKYWLGRNIEWFDKHLPVSPYASMDSAIIETAPFYDIYNMQGMYLGRYDEYKSLLSRLPHGIYIINGNKIKN